MWKNDVFCSWGCWDVGPALMKHRQTMFLPGVTWSDRLTRWHHTRCIMGCGTVTERPLTTEVSWWPLTHRAADGPLDSSHSWLWLNALYIVSSWNWKGSFKVAVINIFISYQMKMRRFLVSAARLQRVSARRLSVQTKDSSHDVIFALRDAWRRKNNHGCTDKLCINGTCRVIIL